jgi:hypothetical protein
MLIHLANPCQRSSGASGKFIWALRQAVDTLFREDKVYMESSQ